MANLPEWCALGVWPCWYREEWISFWSGFGGAALAFIAAVTFEAWRRSRDRAGAKRRFDEVHRRFREAIIPYLNPNVLSYGHWPPHEERAAAAEETVQMYAVLNWARRRPDLFDDAHSVRIEELGSNFDDWFEQARKAGGFTSAFYRRETDGGALARLGTQLVDRI